MDRPDDPFRKLVRLMDVLRGPGGCPWDREQTRETLKPFLVEEAYEVLDALDADDPEQLCEELGDLLLQIVFHCRIAKEKEEFDIDDVCRKVYEKMIRRHPHVFGEARYENSGDLLRDWEDIKAAERRDAGSRAKKGSLMDGVPSRLPALHTTYQVSSKAARVGFDWADVRGIRRKIEEEFDELERALEKGDPIRIREELGDLLFSTVNVARFLQIDPETCLQEANRKFSRRFQAMERHFASRNRSLKEVPPEEMERFWQKQKESAGSEAEGFGETERVSAAPTACPPNRKE